MLSVPSGPARAEDPALIDLLLHGGTPTEAAVHATLVDLVARGLLRGATVDGAPAVDLAAGGPAHDLRLTVIEKAVLELVRSRSRSGPVPVAALTLGPAQVVEPWLGTLADDARARATAAGLLTARWPRRLTPAGRYAASTWQGVARAWRDAPALSASLQEASREQGYAVALGLPVAAVTTEPPWTLTVPTEGEVWSPAGERWRRVRLARRRRLGTTSPSHAVRFGALAVPVSTLLVLVSAAVVALTWSGGPARLLFLAGSLIPVTLLVAGVRSLRDGLSDRGHPALRVDGVVVAQELTGNSDGDGTWCVAVDDGRTDQAEWWAVTGEQHALLRHHGPVRLVYTPRLRFVKEVVALTP